jgi:hypothetical protein
MSLHTAPIPRRLSTRRPSAINLALANEEMRRRLELATERHLRLSRLVRSLSDRLNLVTARHNELVEWAVRAEEQHEHTLTGLAFAVDCSVLDQALRLGRHPEDGALFLRAFPEALFELPPRPTE